MAKWIFFSKTFADYSKTPNDSKSFFKVRFKNMYKKDNRWEGSWGTAKKKKKAKGLRDTDG